MGEFRGEVGGKSWTKSRRGRNPRRKGLGAKKKFGSNGLRSDLKV
jgi:hypothetical protein